MISSKLSQFVLSLFLFCAITTATIFGYADSAQAGRVAFPLTSGNHFTYLEAEMKVPQKKVKQGVVSIWPGLQPIAGSDPDGVLQPIVASVNPRVSQELDICSLNHYKVNENKKKGRPDKGNIPAHYSGWYIQSFYDTGESICEGSDPIPVEGGHSISASVTLDGDTWYIDIQDLDDSTKTLHYPKSLPNNQDQIIAFFAVEPRYKNEKTQPAKWKQAATFSNIVMEVANKDTHFCVDNIPPSCTTPTISKDGLTCKIASCKVSP